MFKVIFQHAPKYLGATGFASLLTLLMTKYYTSVFTPAEYGVLALYLVMFNYIRTFVSLNMDSSATRFYFDYRESRRDEYLSTIFWFISIIALVVFILAMLFGSYVSNWIAPNSLTIYLVTVITGIGAVYVSFLMRILYNEQKSTSVFKHTIFQNIVNHLSSVIFISLFHWGVAGRVTGQGLGYILNIFTLLKEFVSQNLFKLKLVFNKQMAKETFMLSLPSIIASFQTVVFVYLDRIFIKHYIGDSAVGIYTLGYMLGQGLSMVYEAISQAILPKVYSGMNENYEKARDELEHFSYRYYLGLVIVTIIISALSPIIIGLFSNENYSEASKVMPFVMAGFMMGGFYKIPSLVLGFHKVVWFYPFLSAVAFGTNALLNWWLIPLYGIVGSAYASFLGYFINSFIIALFSLKFLSKKTNFFIVSLYIMTLVAVTFSFIGVI